MVLQRALRAAVLIFALGWTPAAAVVADGDVARLLPEAGSLDGWRVAEGPDSYDPGTLYEQIDGAAPRYLAYGFRRLIHVRYESEDDPGASVTLDIYDMGTDLGAFGIYRSRLSRSAEGREWGVEGDRSGTIAAAWKGGVFVHAEADDDRPASIAMLERLLPLVCEGISGDASLPSVLGPLPSEGRVHRSERYLAEDLLGHAFLPGGVLATYAIDGREARLFFSDLGGEDAVGEALAVLRAHQARVGDVVRDVSTMGADGFQYTDPGLGSGIVVGAGRYVAGVHGDLAIDAQDRLLKQLVDNLGSSFTQE